MSLIPSLEILAATTLADMNDPDLYENLSLVLIELIKRQRFGRRSVFSGRTILDFHNAHIVQEIVRRMYNHRIVITRFKIDSTEDDIKTIDFLTHPIFMCQQFMFLDSIHIHSLVPIGNLHQLRALQISNTQIESLAGLENCPQLERLSLLMNEKLKCITVLKNLRCLRELNIEESPKLEDLSPVSNCSEMEVIDILYTSIRDVDCLKDLKKLKSLVLRYCTKIKAVHALSELESLHYLGLDGCTGLSQDDIIKSEISMPECYISY